MLSKDSAIQSTSRPRESMCLDLRTPDESKSICVLRLPPPWRPPLCIPCFLQPNLARRSRVVTAFLLHHWQELHPCSTRTSGWRIPRPYEISNCERRLHLLHTLPLLPQRPQSRESSVLHVRTVGDWETTSEDPNYNSTLRLSSFE